MERVPPVSSTPDHFLHGDGAPRRRLPDYACRSAPSVARVLPLHLNWQPALKVAPNSLPGKALPSRLARPPLYCAVIVKPVDAQTRDETGINELLRE